MQLEIYINRRVSYLAKKISYKVGDIFAIELENDLKGFGRILKIDTPTVFIELYKLKPVEHIETINELEKYSPILSIWSTDLGLNKALWAILGNKPVVGEIEMPAFYKRDAMNPNKYTIIKGGETFEVAKDQIGDAQPYGIFGHEAVKIRYTHELKQSGLI